MNNKPYITACVSILLITAALSGCGIDETKMQEIARIEAEKVMEAYLPVPQA